MDLLYLLTKCGKEWSVFSMGEGGHWAYQSKMILNYLDSRVLSDWKQTKIEKLAISVSDQAAAEVASAKLCDGIGRAGQGKHSFRRNSRLTETRGSSQLQKICRYFVRIRDPWIGPFLSITTEGVLYIVRYLDVIIIKSTKFTRESKNCV